MLRSELLQPCELLELVATAHPRSELRDDDVVTLRVERLSRLQRLDGLGRCRQVRVRDLVDRPVDVVLLTEASLLDSVDARVLGSSSLAVLVGLRAAFARSETLQLAVDVGQGRGGDVELLGGGSHCGLLSCRLELLLVHSRETTLDE